jgi:hypothetical protein
VDFRATRLDSHAKRDCFRQDPVPIALEHGIPIPWQYGVFFHWDIDAARVSRKVPSDVQVERIIPDPIIIGQGLSVIAICMLLFLFLAWKTEQCGSALSSASDIPGWRLIHGDVWREPKGGHVLALFVSIGVQILTAALFLIISKACGLIETINGVGGVTLAISVWISGIVSGLSGGWITSIAALPSKRTFANIIPASIISELFIGIVLAALYYSNAITVVSPIILLTICGFDFAMKFLGYLISLISCHNADNGVNQIPSRVPSRVLATPLRTIFGGFFLCFTVSSQFGWIRRIEKSGRLAVLIGVLAVLVQGFDIGAVLTFLTVSYEDYRWWWPAFGSGFSAFLGLFAMEVYNSGGSVFADRFVGGETVLGVLVVSLVMGSVTFVGSALFMWMAYRKSEASLADLEQN